MDDLGGFLSDRWPSRRVDGPIDTAPRDQGIVGCIDDGINRHPGDVIPNDVDDRRVAHVSSYPRAPTLSVSSVRSISRANILRSMSLVSSVP